MLKASPIFIFALVLASCAELQPPAPAENETLDGPIEGLDAAQMQQFIRGDVAFNDQVFTFENGLGPLFIATSCGGCHPGDGKGHPFTTLTRFGQTDDTGNHFIDQGGPQLQHRAIPGFTPEMIPPGALASRFTPPANTGLGLVDAVTDADILAWSDPTDADADGISGVPNWVALKGYLTERPSSITQSGKYIGRFGKKASTYDLLQQTSQAYNQDMGVNSVFEAEDTYSHAQHDPEIADQTILDVVAYLKTLKAPVPRTENSDILSGKQYFSDIGCSKCHRPEMKTGASRISALANKTFYPYSDLLLHDMGPGLDDGYTEGSAKTYEWRTPPLWGLGLSKKSQGGQYYLLHDGRATSIEQAITLHGGEAFKSKNDYNAMMQEQKKKLIQFLESL